jgi:hypothetical protein
MREKIGRGAQLCVSTLCAVLLASFLAGEVSAQSRVWKRLTGWRYPNTKNYNDAVGDTFTDSAIDSVAIGVLSYSATGGGYLVPLAVTISVQITDADISGTPDSALVRYQLGVGGTFHNYISSTTYDSVRTLSTGAPQPGNPFTRTFVYSLDGDVSAEKNTQTAVASHFDAIRLIFSKPAVQGDSMSYRIKAYGLYEQ